MSDKRLGALASGGVPDLRSLVKRGRQHRPPVLRKHCRGQPSNVSDERLDALPAGGIPDPRIVAIARQQFKWLDSFVKGLESIAIACFISKIIALTLWASISR